MGVHRPGRRPSLLSHELIKQFLLVRPQRVARADPLGHVIAQQDRGAFAIVIAEIRTMLGITNECGQVGREGPRDLGRIGEPLVFVGLEPAKTITDDRPAADLIA